MVCKPNVHNLLYTVCYSGKFSPAAFHDRLTAAIGPLLFRAPDTRRPVAAEGHPELFIGWIVGGSGSRVGGRRQEQSTIRTS